MFQAGAASWLSALSHVFNMAIQLPFFHMWQQHAGEDTDKPKTFEDQMQLKSKVRLMKQFQWGVAAYVIAKAAAILLPPFLYKPEDSTDVTAADKAVKTVYILQNCVRWLFLAAMCWIFR